MNEGKGVFDWALYGALIRHRRNELGIKKAADFSDAVYRRTRVRISRDSIYKIEQGRQVPDAVQFMAVNMALFGQAWPDWRISLEQCMSPEWKRYNEEEGTGPAIPDEWRVQNLRADAAGALGIDESEVSEIYVGDLPEGSELELYIPDAVLEEWYGTHADSIEVDGVTVRF